jgi:hypothetical protein
MPHSKRPSRNRLALFTAPVAVDDGVKVIGVVATPPLTGSWAFPNEHAYPAGRNVPPEAQVSVTVPANPPPGLTETVPTPGLPAVMAMGFGDTPRLNVAASSGTATEFAACQWVSPR